MDSLEKNSKDISSIYETIKQIEASKPTKIQRVKTISAKIAATSRNLDEAVANLGDLLNEVLDNELLDERLGEILTDKGYLDPKNNPIGIPNSLTESNSDKFDSATQFIIHSQDSELRNHAMFLISLCSSLMFERSLVDNELQQAREGRRKAILEIMKIQQKLDRRSSPHSPNLRF